MSSRDLAPQTVDWLRAAGWYPGRAVDVSGYVECWRVREISPNPHATEFCAEFGELKIDHLPELTIGTEVHRDFTHIDGCRATISTGERALREYARLADEEVCPVGRNRSHMTVLIGPSGVVLGGVDAYLYRFGPDPNTALDNICSGAQPVLVGEWRLSPG